MKINMALVLRLDETVVQEFDNVAAATEEIEHLKENLLKKDEKFYNKYRIDVTFQVKDGSYYVSEYSSQEIMLARLEELEYNSRNIEDLQDIYNDIINQDEIPQIWEYMVNDCEHLKEYFNDITTFIKAVQYGDYNIHDEYVKFNGYGNLVSCNYIPYQDYEQEIFNQWLKENI